MAGFLELCYVYKWEVHRGGTDKTHEVGWVVRFWREKKHTHTHEAQPHVRVNTGLWSREARVCFIKLIGPCIEWLDGRIYDSIASQLQTLKINYEKFIQILGFGRPAAGTLILWGLFLTSNNAYENINLVWKWKNLVKSFFYTITWARVHMIYIKSKIKQSTFI